MTASQPSVKIFLSMVTSEFQIHRKLLTGELRRSWSIEVKVQEDFGEHAGTLMHKLDEYIKHCNLVIHLIGQAAGSSPTPNEVEWLTATYPDLTERVPFLAEVFLNKQEGSISYTQWEAYLAIYHFHKTDASSEEDGRGGLLIVNHLPPGSHLPVTAASDRGLDKSQQVHLDRLIKFGWDCTSTFSEPKDLSTLVYRSLYDRHLANERPSEQWSRLLWVRGRKAWEACCRWWQTLHENAKATPRALTEDRSTSYWCIFLLRACAVVQAVRVVLALFSEVNLQALLQDRSLQGMQQVLFFQWLTEFNILHVFLVVGIGWLIALAWPWIVRQWEQLRNLWSTRREKDHWHKLIAKAGDLALMPLELTIALPTIPFAAKRWMESVERMPPVNGINPTFFAYAGIAALEAAFAACIIARYWPAFRRWRRNFRSPSPWPSAILLAIAGALGLWILFDPLLIPTGSAGSFSTTGSVVTHVATDSTTTEVAIASAGRRFRSTSKDSVSIEFATLPTLKELRADLDGVPWEVKADPDRLLGLAFYQRLLTAQLGGTFIPDTQTFRVWHRDHSSQVIKAVSPGIATLGNGGENILDELGRVISYRNKNPSMMLENQDAPDVRAMVPEIFVGWVIGESVENLKPVPSPWIAELDRIQTASLSRDGHRLAIAGRKFIPKDPSDDNPWNEGRTEFRVGIVDLGSANVVWSDLLPTSPSEMAFSPDGEWLSTADDGVDRTNPLTESLGTLSTEDRMIFHRLRDHTAKTIPLSEHPEAIVWSPDSRCVAVRYPYRLEVYSVLSGEKMKSFISPRGKLTCHLFSPDSRFLVAGSDKGRVWMYQVGE